MDEKRRLERESDSSGLSFDPMQHEEAIMNALQNYRDQTTVSNEKRMENIRNLHNSIEKRENKMKDLQRLYKKDNIKLAALTMFLQQANEKKRKKMERRREMEELALREEQKRLQMLTTPNNNTLLMMTESTDRQLLEAPDNNYYYEDGFLIEVNCFIVHH
jgi:hypothetical protein